MRIVVFVGSPVDADEKDVRHSTMMEFFFSCFVLPANQWHKRIKVIAIMKVITTKLIQLALSSGQENCSSVTGVPVDCFFSFFSSIQNTCHYPLFKLICTSVLLNQ